MFPSRRTLMSVLPHQYSLKTLFDLMSFPSCALYSPVLELKQNTLKDVFSIDFIAKKVVFAIISLTRAWDIMGSEL